MDPSDRSRLTGNADPYVRLGLAPGATPADVRHAYRSLAMRLHPDRAGATHIDEFLAVTDAYETLRANPRFTMSSSRSGSTAAPAAGYRAAPPPRGAHASTFTAPSGKRGRTWSGGRWYWEGLAVNAAKRAQHDR